MASSPQQQTIMDAPTRSVSLVDPRMNVNKKRYNIITIGPKNSTYRPIVSDSGLNAEVVNFSYNNTSVYDIVDRRFYLKYYLEIEVKTDEKETPTAYGTSDALRFLPINASATSVQLTINNASQTVIPYQWLDGISRYIPMDILRKDLSASPSTPDLMHSYRTIALDQGPPFYPGIVVTGSKNVLANYTSNGINNPNLRGTEARLVSLSETEGVSNFQFEIMEPLFIPPLSYQEKDLNGFIGVESLSLQLSHLWEAGVVWSHGGDVLLTEVNVSFYRQPELLLNILSPNELVEPYNPNWTYLYNSSYLKSYITPVGEVKAGSQTTIAGSNIQLNSIPSRIYIYARQKKSLRNSTIPDTFLRIDSVSISLGNKVGLLSTADTRDLFQISHKNGYAYDFDAFNYYQGGVLCLKSGEDLSLDLGEAPGLVVQKQLQVNMTCTNQTHGDMDIEMVVVPVLGGSFNIKNGFSSQSVGLMNPNDVLTAPRMDDMDYDEYSNFDIYGGSWKNFWKGFKKGFRAVTSPALDIAEEVVPYGKLMRYPRKKLGLGMMDESKGGLIVGGKKKRSKKSGGLISGGCMDCKGVNYTSRDKLKTLFQKK